MAMLTLNIILLSYYWRWITSTIYSWINIRNGTNGRICIGLEFKLINSTSFDESLFSAGLFQKTTKRDLFVKGKFRIKIRHIHEKTLEDMRRHRNEVESEGLPSGAGRPHLQPTRPLWDSSMSFWSILPPSLRMHFSCTSSRFDPRAHVGPPRLYNETLAPLKPSSHLEIKPSRARNPNSSEFL
jgi:hypothetical protein